MKADLHVHTNFSYDGLSSPKEIVEAAIKKNIDCICITDHEEIKGAVEAMKFGFDKDILVIPGIEILTTSGDLLGINVKKIIPSGLPVEQTVKEIRKQGGIAVIPHPFDKPMTGFWGGEKKLRTIDIDGIEVFNGSVILKRSNQKALNFCQRMNLSFTAGSDAHKAGFVGRGYIEFPKDVRSVKGLIEEIINKKGEVRGRALSFWEVLKNITSADAKKTIGYCRLRLKNKKNNKYAKRTS